MSFIYKLSAGSSIYIGMTNNPKKRFAYHKHLLKKEEHFNEGLQKAYNRHGSVEIEIISETNDPTTEEKLTISKYKESGYDVVNVSGGVGLTGLKRSKAFKEKLSKRMSGEDNPQSKITNEQFFEIVEMLKEGKSNSEIAKVYKLHPNYISLIRHKKRHASLWEDVDFEPSTSNGKRAFDYKTFTSILGRYKEVGNMQRVADEYSVDRSVISRIINKKVYKDYWKAYESGSTTIERA